MAKLPTCGISGAWPIAGPRTGRQGGRLRYTMDSFSAEREGAFQRVSRRSLNFGFPRKTA